MRIKPLQLNLDLVGRARAVSQANRSVEQERLAAQKRDAEASKREADRRQKEARSSEDEKRKQEPRKEPAVWRKGGGDAPTLWVIYVRAEGSDLVYYAHSVAAQEVWVELFRLPEKMKGVGVTGTREFYRMPLWITNDQPHAVSPPGKTGQTPQLLLDDGIGTWELSANELLKSESIKTVVDFQVNYRNSSGNLEITDYFSKEPGLAGADWSNWRTSRQAWDYRHYWDDFSMLASQSAVVPITESRPSFLRGQGEQTSSGRIMGQFAYAKNWYANLRVDIWSPWPPRPIYASYDLYNQGIGEPIGYETSRGYYGFNTVNKVLSLPDGNLTFAGFVKGAEEIDPPYNCYLLTAGVGPVYINAEPLNQSSARTLQKRLDSIFYPGRNYSISRWETEYSEDKLTYHSITGDTSAIKPWGRYPVWDRARYPGDVVYSYKPRDSQVPITFNYFTETLSEEPFNEREGYIWKGRDIDLRIYHCPPSEEGGRGCLFIGPFESNANLFDPAMVYPSLEKKSAIASEESTLSSLRQYYTERRWGGSAGGFGRVNEPNPSDYYQRLDYWSLPGIEIHSRHVLQVRNGTLDWYPYWRSRIDDVSGYGASGFGGLSDDEFSNVSQECEIFWDSETFDGQFRYQQAPEHLKTWLNDFFGGSTGSVQYKMGRDDWDWSSGEYRLLFAAFL